jgi:hypothetical protein
MLICIALAMARFVCPDTLMAGHDRTRAVAGYMPAAAKKVPAYERPGRPVGLVFASKRIYPIAATADEPAINTARFPSRSEATATLRVVQNARA